jgi:hypothetical protein
MSADLAGFVGGCGLMTMSDTCGEGGRISSELSESSPDDETHVSIRMLTGVFIGGSD